MKELEVELLERADRAIEEARVALDVMRERVRQLVARAGSRAVSGDSLMTRQTHEDARGAPISPSDDPSSVPNALVLPGAPSARCALKHIA